MSVFDKHHDTLERHETMMAPRADAPPSRSIFTDSLALVGSTASTPKDRFLESRRWTSPSSSSS